MSLTTGGEQITELHRREFWGRDFWGDEEWNQMKGKLDQMLARRNAMKGPPDEHQRVELALDKAWIEFYRALLFPKVPQ